MTAKATAYPICPDEALTQAATPNMQPRRRPPTRAAIGEIHLLAALETRKSVVIEGADTEERWTSYCLGSRVAGSPVIAVLPIKEEYRLTILTTGRPRDNEPEGAKLHGQRREPGPPKTGNKPESTGGMRWCWSSEV